MDQRKLAFGFRPLGSLPAPSGPSVPSSTFQLPTFLQRGQACPFQLCLLASHLHRSLPACCLLSNPDVAGKEQVFRGKAQV